MATLDQTVLPVQPGYNVARFKYVNRKPTVDYVKENLRVTPVIGWRVLGDIVLPITIGGDTSTDVEVICIPGGMVYAADGRSWKGLDAFALACVASWKAWIAELPKEPSPTRALMPGNVILGPPADGFRPVDEVTAA